MIKCFGYRNGHAEDIKYKIPHYNNCVKCQKPKAQVFWGIKKDNGPENAYHTRCLVLVQAARMREASKKYTYVQSPGGIVSGETL